VFEDRYACSLLRPEWATLFQKSASLSAARLLTFRLSLTSADSSRKNYSSPVHSECTWRLRDDPVPRNDRGEMMQYLMLIYQDEAKM
jgi:hypothetical protein